VPLTNGATLWRSEKLNFGAQVQSFSTQRPKLFLNIIHDLTALWCTQARHFGLDSGAMCTILIVPFTNSHTYSM